MMDDGFVKRIVDLIGHNLQILLEKGTIVVI